MNLLSDVAILLQTLSSPPPPFQDFPRDSFGNPIVTPTRVACPRNQEVEVMPATALGTDVYVQSSPEMSFTPPRDQRGQTGAGLAATSYGGSMLIKRTVGQSTDACGINLPVKKKRHRLKNFVCPNPSCGKAFVDNAHLRDHMISHSGQKKFECLRCGKLFARQSSMKSHQRVHTGEKPYVCELCGKAYASKGGIKLHKASHTGIRPFLCTHAGCGKTFIVAQQLRKHKRQHLKLTTEVAKNGSEGREEGGEGEAWQRKPTSE